ncbi:MAG: hypothetical protein HY718_15700, partial [Planctomycetes bacterium]|nr:hypothetical protein [Planctomycetota bacterium]
IADQIRQSSFLPDSIETYVEKIALVALVVPILWTWLTYLSLLIFRISLQRARIQPVHMLRCSLYSFDPLACACVLTIVGAGVPWLFLPQSVRQFMPLRDADLLVYLMLLGWGLCVALGGYRLWRALALYLRFDHALGTMIASQAITFLAVLNWLMLDNTHLILDLLCPV